jgi:hypothetical protein
MSTEKVDLTFQFRSQARVVTSFANSIDIAYLNGELSELYSRIVADAKVNRLQEVYCCYLYGQSFINYSQPIQTIALMELRKKGLSGFKMNFISIGSKSELATYPLLAGIKIQITTVN